MAPLFTAVSSSARQLLLLLRCISFAKKAQVQISQQGIRFTTEEGSAMEAFVLLEKSLFTTYSYKPIAAPTSGDEEEEDTPIFQISLSSLLETLHIFSLSDPAAVKRPGEFDAFAAHRLSRHAGINAFSNQALGMTGICTFTYAGDGHPFSIHMSEAGVTTTCDLTTYEAGEAEEIPFDRDSLALKTILRSVVLLDAVNELASLNPATLTIHGNSTSRPGANLALVASGALGSATVELTATTSSDTPILETFYCPVKTTASFQFPHFKAAQRAMAAASKVSLRLDNEGVLSLQFLVEVETNSGGGEPVAFVDFRMVPLVEGEGEGEESDDDGEGNNSQDST